MKWGSCNFYATVPNCIHISTGLTIKDKCLSGSASVPAPSLFHSKSICIYLTFRRTVSQPFLIVGNF